MNVGHRSSSDVVSRLCLFALVFVGIMNVVRELAGYETADRWWAALLAGTVLVFKLGEVLWEKVR